jgi:hypothetical protein
VGLVGVASFCPDAGDRDQHQGDQYHQWMFESIEAEIAAFRCEAEILKRLLYGGVHKIQN